MITILVFMVAMSVSTVVYPLALNYAKRHNIVDNPNARKLQRVPVPVLGGVVVYAGTLAGSLILFMFMKEPLLLWGLVGMTMMLVIGIIDDMKNLSAALRFAVEILMVAVFIAMTGVYLDDFHGLWGIHELSPWFGIPFSVFAGVGVINAVNLIDGVDGYSSGYSMLACGCFALMFHSVWSPTMVCMAVIVAGALLPFFMHNVFGVRSKMFIGDGGTLMLGMLMVMFLFFAISSKTHCNLLEDWNISLAALCLAVMSIPVFDTLRVMLMRVLRGKSPFRPDKTHLHHLFIDMGFSHLGAALSILMVNILIVVLWLVSWLLGASIDAQTYIVLVLGFLVMLFYKVMKTQQNGGPRDEEGYPQGTAMWHWFCHQGFLSHREKGRVWQWLRWLMDSRFITRLYVTLTLFIGLFIVR
jgi:UDP-N-acetylmuramyl pentapeptide phosphotransferase/UDP-N-acetylglucosamine-1-phosphate transferase